ncbi:MAG: pyruvate kinase [Planctomycetes bacterium]|nr:pyruvate kinase [Planctomycetota bacterium]
MPEPSTPALTKIIATVGPACGTPAGIARLIEEGARVFRINFSHGSFDGFAQSLDAIRAASQSTGEIVGALGDLSGPKIRLGQIKDGGLDLAVGDLVEFQRAPLVGERRADRVALSTNYPAMVDEVGPGERLLIDDGNVRLLTIDRLGSGDDRRVLARVTVGGRISNSKGVNLPDNNSAALPSLTEHDHRCVEWAVKNGIDYLALSFVRRGQDVSDLRNLLAKQGEAARSIPIIAKIEKPQAVEALDSIVQASDAVMVARGDLGVEMDLAEVPGVQKRVISVSHEYGKPVIVATQMLQSMIDSPVPTRAEVSDVANAIYDGADAVMLSGETAVGKWPAQAVHQMSRVALATQRVLHERGEFNVPPKRLQESRYRTAALAHGVSVVVRDLDAKLVVTWSEAGGGARYLSQNRLHIPILAAGSNPATLRRMTLLFGVIPIQLPKPADGAAFLHQIEPILIERALARPGDPIVVVKGEPIGTPGVTNELLIHHVGDLCRLTEKR